ERRLPRLLSVAPGRSAGVRALVRDDGVGPDVPSIRADGAARRRARRWSTAPDGRSRLHSNPLDCSRSANAFATQSLRDSERFWGRAAPLSATALAER